MLDLSSMLLGFNGVNRMAVRIIKKGGDAVKGTPVKK